jgi:hypothetical protein
MTEHYILNKIPIVKIYKIFYYIKILLLQMGVLYQSLLAKVILILLKVYSSKILPKNMEQQYLFKKVNNYKFKYQK